MAGIEARLLEIERRLDPRVPERVGGVRLLGYGEVSAVLGLDECPDRVFKRMSGFPSRAAALAYTAVVQRYVALLGECDVTVAPTALVPLEPAPGRHVVYVMQPRFDAARFGHALLHAADTADVFALLERVLGLVHDLLGANARRGDGRDLAVDAQLSNWYWPAADGRERRPVLVDVATPFMRKDGCLETGVDLFLRAYLAPLRWYLRRTRAVERYIADYFDFERTVLDLLGNFVKEGAAEQVPAAVARVNDWLARHPDRGRWPPIDEPRVHRYYARDAADLELSLRARRLTRMLRRLAGRRYDFILPGRIERGGASL